MQNERLEDIFEIQDEISQKVAVSIFPALKANELKRFNNRKNIDFSSWDQYLQGLAFLNKSKEVKELESRLEFKKKVVSHCEKAIEIDVSFSEPHLVIASCMIDFIFSAQLASERS